jgi:hypothetical protein
MYMKKLKFTTACCILIMLLAPAMSLAIESMWVVSEGARLKADCVASSETVEDLPVGTEIFVRSYEKRWYLVFTAEGDNGWIYRGKVSNSLPEGLDIDDEEDFFQVEYDESSIDGEQVYTARSIRGVTSVDSDGVNQVSDVAKEYGQNRKMPEKYQKALYDVITMEKNDDEIELFLTAGKIGEYDDN